MGLVSLLIVYLIGSANVKMILSLFVAFVGFLSIIKPIRFFGIRSRLKAIGILFVGIVFLFVSTTFLPDSQLASNNQVPLSIDEYKEQSKALEYDELARQTEEYINTKVKLTGQIIQVQELTEKKIVLRVNITKKDYGYYEDTVWVNYEYRDGEKRVLLNDIINIWGEVKGRKSYTSILGAKFTIPEINGRFIEILKK